MVRSPARTLALAVLAVFLLLPQPLGAAPQSDAELPGGFRGQLARMLESSTDPRAEAAQVMAGAFAEDDPTPVDHEFEAEIYLRNAGDLDGDGRQDSLEIADIWSYEGDSYETLVTAVRSSDGTDLWRATPLSDESYIFGARGAGDLDGDGLGDVILYEGRDAVRFICCDPTAFSGAWGVLIRAVRGVDGTPLWVRPSGGAGADVITDENWEEGVGDWIDLAYPIGTPTDLDGDAVNDFVILHYAVMYQWNDDEEIYTGSDIHASYEVFSGGKRGAPVAVIPGGAGYSDAAIVPDLNADGVADLVILSIEDQGTTLRAHTGAAGRPIWTTTVEADLSYAYILGMKLNGDATSDVLVNGVHWSEDDNITGTALARSGVDGAALWTQPISPFTFVSSIGDATGDGASEIAVLPLSWWFEFEATPLNHVPNQIVTLNGADGTTLWRRTYPKFRFASVAGDTNNDGVTDLLVSYRRRVGKKFRAVFVVASGRTGGVRWSQPGKDTWISALRADVNGDGATDFYREVGRGYDVVSGKGGGALWPRRSSMGIYLNDLEPLAHPGGYDIAESWVNNQWQPITSLRSGDRGTLRWKRVFAI